MFEIFHYHMKYFTFEVVKISNTTLLFYCHHLYLIFARKVREFIKDTRHKNKHDTGLAEGGLPY